MVLDLDLFLKVILLGEKIVGVREVAYRDIVGTLVKWTAECERNLSDLLKRHRFGGGQHPKPVRAGGFLPLEWLKE